MLQYCGDCQKFWLTAYSRCPACLAALQWRETPGMGAVETYSIIPAQDRPGSVASIVANVRLDEGPVIPAAIVGADPRDLKARQRVRVHFIENAGEEPTPAFMPLEKQ